MGQELIHIKDTTGLDSTVLHLSYRVYDNYARIGNGEVVETDITVYYDSTHITVKGDIGFEWSLTSLNGDYSFGSYTIKPTTDMIDLNTGYIGGTRFPDGIYVITVSNEYFTRVVFKILLFRKKCSKS